MCSGSTLGLKELTAEFQRWKSVGSWGTPSATRLVGEERRFLNVPCVAPCHWQPGCHPVPGEPISQSPQTPPRLLLCAPRPQAFCISCLDWGGGLRLCHPSQIMLVCRLFSMVLAAVIFINPTPGRGIFCLSSLCGCFGREFRPLARPGPQQHLSARPLPPREEPALAPPSWSSSHSGPPLEGPPSRLGLLVLSQ